MHPNDSESLDSWQARKERNKAKWGNNGMGTPLGVAVRLWHTPQASDGEGSRTGVSGTSETGRTPDGRKVSTSLQSDLRDQAGRLNPAWVETLMGFPVGWTDFGPPVPANAKPRGSHRERSLESSRPDPTD
jgi:hypothetical protein